MELGELGLRESWRCHLLISFGTARSSFQCQSPEDPLQLIVLDGLRNVPHPSWVEHTEERRISPQSQNCINFLTCSEAAADSQTFLGNFTGQPIFTVWTRRRYTVFSFLCQPVHKEGKRIVDDAELVAGRENSTISCRLEPPRPHSTRQSARIAC